MVAFNKFQSFAEAVYEGKHDMENDTLRVLLTNTLPVTTNSVKTDITEIAGGGGYTAGGMPVAGLAGVTSAQTTGTYKLDANDVVITATAGGIATFQYAVLYNDSAPADELIGWWDNGSAINLAELESVTLQWDAGGILTHA